MIEVLPIIFWIWLTGWGIVIAFGLLDCFYFTKYPCIKMGPMVTYVLCGMIWPWLIIAMIVMFIDERYY